MILLRLERGLELMRKLEANGVTWEGTRIPESHLSPGELETYYTSCPSLNFGSTGFPLGGFCPPPNACQYLEIVLLIKTREESY